MPRWRELSRNKSRDEREMWPNRTAHTDTVSRGRREKGEEGDPAGFPRCSYIARSFHDENFRVNAAIAG